MIINCWTVGTISKLFHNCSVLQSRLQPVSWSSLVSNCFGSELVTLGACCWKYYSDIREGMKVNALTFSILVTQVEAEYVCVFCVKLFLFWTCFVKKRVQHFCAKQRNEREMAPLTKQQRQHPTMPVLPLASLLCSGESSSHGCAGSLLWSGFWLLGTLRLRQEHPDVKVLCQIQTELQDLLKSSSMSVKSLKKIKEI